MRRTDMLVEMVVESVRVNLNTYQRVVVLKEKATERYLPIWIGNTEADAIALADRVQAPIFAEATVLDKAGVALDGDATNGDSETTAEVSPAVREEELKKLSVFRDFINTLDLDDLGKREK
jgi:bifunctional DNase/RNase